MPDIALASQGAAGGPIIDKTGIQGDYDIAFHSATVRNPDTNLPDIFTTGSTSLASDKNQGTQQ